MLDEFMKVCMITREPTELENAVRVNVTPGNIDRAIKALKRKMQSEGIFRDMRRKEVYEKPSERRRREQAEAVGRYRKEQRRKAEREV